MSDLKGVRVEYHILQSFPVTCLNRDDVGSPKTAVIGGVKRLRISSQCWKRQVRLCMHGLGVKIALRTKKIADAILSEIPNADEAMIGAAGKIATELTKDALYFLSPEEENVYREEVKTNSEEINKMAAKELTKHVTSLGKECMKKGYKNLDGVDIALFGRMVAKATDLNVEAAASFSHAITTHKAGAEVDYFTAVDDFAFLNGEKGAGHVDTAEISSGTYYRYISLDLGMLQKAIGDEDLQKAIELFTKALFMAVPAAKQKSMAGYCIWDYAQIYVRRGQGMQVSFEKPVKADRDSGYLEPSIKELRAQLDRREKLMGSLFGKVSKHEFGEKEDYTIDNLVSDLKQDISNL